MSHLRIVTTPGEPTCRGKTRYATFTEAKRKARKARQRYDDCLTPYHCIECGGFHFGSRGLSRPSPRLRNRDRIRAEDDGE